MTVSECAQNRTLIYKGENKHLSTTSNANWAYFGNHTSGIVEGADLLD